MDLNQTLRRIGQQSKTGWVKWGKELDDQLPLIQKLYEKYGMELILTCYACPEQYEVFKNGKQVAYYRLRHGEFRVDFPDCGGETIFEAEPEGDGTFEAKERVLYLTRALRKVLKKLSDPTF